MRLNHETWKTIANDITEKYDLLLIKYQDILVRNAELERHNRELVDKLNSDHLKMVK